MAAPALILAIAVAGPSWEWVANLLVAIIGAAMTVILGFVVRYLARIGRKVDAAARQHQQALAAIHETLSGMKSRLDAGDRRFERLDERDRSIETRMVEGLTKIDTRVNHVESLLKEIASRQ